MLASIPLLVLVVAACNVLVLMTGTPVETVAATLALPPAGAPFPVTAGDLLVAAGLVLLYLEVLKATRTGSASILDHLLSIVLFIVCGIELLVVPEMASATFLILTLMTLIDVIAGFTVTISTARRDFGIDGSLR